LGRNIVAPRGCQKVLTSITLQGKYSELTDPGNPYTSTSLETYSNYYNKIFMTECPTWREDVHYILNALHEWHNPQGQLEIKLKNLIQTVW
jgi:hypothetical protein